MALKGGSHPRRQPDRGDQGQRRNLNRRSPLPPRGRSGQSLLRRGEPDLRRVTAGTDHHAQRDR